MISSDNPDFGDTNYSDRLSIMYSFIQQSRGGDTDDYQPLPGSDIGGDEYTAHKCDSDGLYLHVVLR